MKIKTAQHASQTLNIQFTCKEMVGKNEESQIQIRNALILFRFIS